MQPFGALRSVAAAQADRTATAYTDQWGRYSVSVCPGFNMELSIGFQLRR